MNAMVDKAVSSGLANEAYVISAKRTMEDQVPGDTVVHFSPLPLKWVACSNNKKSSFKIKFYGN
jgi:hypothetical protein